MFKVKNFGAYKIHLAVVALCLLVPTSAWAQSITATIVGTVTDPGGAAVPNAQVTARNVETGLSRTVTSSDEGTYRIEFLPVGKYTVDVTLSGFKRANVSDIVLEVNDTKRVDVSLSVG
ncbi:MAG TPA: carboxypeptidase-like regulatory domain-containing protein, partial [Pyrinomonadaceae bacterium]|nr:carboxypeptidase-like regulatory domain-containing protein [Pyrinomonadaceae bacterium]